MKPSADLLYPVTVIVQLMKSVFYERAKLSPRKPRPTQYPLFEDTLVETLNNVISTLNTKTPFLDIVE